MALDCLIGHAEQPINVAKCDVWVREGSRQSMRAGKIGFIFIILFLVYVVAPVQMGAAYAVETSEYGAKYIRDEDPALVDVDIIDFKVQLYELGFYSAGVGEATLQSIELDDLTMAAVKQVCKYNPDLVFYPDGVSMELWWRVMGMVEGELKTPLVETYDALMPGDSGEAVVRVQNRLNQLGYDAAGASFTVGLYDDALQSTVDEFVRCNKFVYDRDEGIPVEMQVLLFSEDALPYTAKEVTEGNLQQRLFAYMSSRGNVLGMAVPMGILWAIGFVMACIIVLLTVKLFIPAEEQNQGTSAGVLRSGEILFRVEYGHETFEYKMDMRKYVRIGRATGTFPLNMADESISRKHCEICMENGELMLRDFSSYGTTINGSMCHHSQQVLHSGDVMEIGEHRITIEFKK